jgi:hypothetical protein
MSIRGNVDTGKSIRENRRVGLIQKPANMSAVRDGLLIKNALCRAGSEWRVVTDAIARMRTLRRLQLPPDDALDEATTTCIARMCHKDKLYKDYMNFLHYIDTRLAAKDETTATHEEYLELAVSQFYNNWDIRLIEAVTLSGAIACIENRTQAVVDAPDAEGARRVYALSRQEAMAHLRGLKSVDESDDSVVTQWKKSVARAIAIIDKTFTTEQEGSVSVQCEVLASEIAATGIGRARTIDQYLLSMPTRKKQRTESVSCESA